MALRGKLLATAALSGMMGVGGAPAAAQDYYIGETILMGTSFCPRNFAQANGQLLAINQNQALFALLGTQYGGNGQTTFALPDLRGRKPIGSGQGSQTTYSVGQLDGVETVTLNTTQIPVHAHTATINAKLPTSSLGPTEASPVGNSLATFPPGTNAYDPGTPDQPGMQVLGSVAIQPAGGGQAHANRAPYLAMTWCVALFGIFPPRN